MFGDDVESAVRAEGAGRWSAMPSDLWNIGDSANGGYVLSLVLGAFAHTSDHADPLSVTTHFLRPVQPNGEAARITVEVVRSGRATTVLQGSLEHDGKERLRVHAVFGELPAVGDAGAGPSLTVEPPEIPRPAACLDRAQLDQGVELPILERLDVRIRPDHARTGHSEDAVVDGWIRFADGTEPSSLALPLFADAFPPSLFPRFGRIGWVPTVELTVHVRRRPAAGWVQARLRCDDLVDGRMIESGSLWDSTGALVARSRQLGLLRNA